MRELKFRAWDIDDKQFIYAHIGQDDVWLDDGIGTTEMPLHHNDFEQYTGLKDKNDKEIYEGDIVKIEAYSRVYQVVYRQWDCSFMFENDEDEDTVNMFNSFPDKYEIIGNIHENPELLENTK